MLTDDDVIDAMRNQLAEDFVNEGAISTPDIPEAVMAALPRPAANTPPQPPEAYSRGPPQNAYLPMGAPPPGGATMPSGPNTVIGVEPPGVGPPGLMHEEGAGYIRAYTGQPTGVPEQETFGVSPIAAPPEYPGPLHYANARATGPYFTTGTGH